MDGKAMQATECNLPETASSPDRANELTRQWQIKETPSTPSTMLQVDYEKKQQVKARKKAEEEAKRRKEVRGRQRLGSQECWEWGHGVGTPGDGRVVCGFRAQGGG